MGDDDVDCSSVVEELFTFLDGELTEVRRTQITTHMHGCVDCHEVIEFHAELKMSISQKCRENVPDDLRLRIAKALGLPATRE
ncbi:MAG TPA: mycothiol system anti-sigma-R factor [Acidimicrobiales bacterium]|jgi:mycothiol system anti-sigma-R factor|nr:mycothiol system anti-sigma-R factor [Acidimicrobiales bacterium]